MAPVLKVLEFLRIIRTAREIARECIKRFPGRGVSLLAFLGRKLNVEHVVPLLVGDIWMSQASRTSVRGKLIFGARWFSYDRGICGRCQLRAGIREPPQPPRAHRDSTGTNSWRPSSSPCQHCRQSSTYQQSTTYLWRRKRRQS